MFMSDNELSIWDVALVNIKINKRLFKWCPKYKQTMDVAPRDCGFIMGDMETIPIPVPRMVFNHNVHKHCPKNLCYK